MLVTANSHLFQQNTAAETQYKLHVDRVNEFAYILTSTTSTVVLFSEAVPSYRKYLPPGKSDVTQRMIWQLNKQNIKKTCSPKQFYEQKNPNKNILSCILKILAWAINLIWLLNRVTLELALVMLCCITVVVVSLISTLGCIVALRVL